MNQNQTDYYQLLQVRFDAEQAEIRNAYHRLSKLYHPDISKLPQAEQMMRQLNQAYETLSDNQKRHLYNNRYVAQHASWPNSGVLASAEQVISDYFDCLLKGSYDKAYHLLCNLVKQRVNQRSFYKWRETVQELYAMRQFSIKKGKLVPDFHPEDKLIVPAEQFHIDVLEKDHASGSLDHYCFSKYVLIEHDSCGDYQGYRDLNEISRMFDVWAREREQNLMQQHWQEHLQSVDRITGLYTRAGLLQQARRELYRARRYDRSITIASLVVKPVQGRLSSALGDEFAEAVAEVLKRSLRMTDIAAHLGQGQFVVLFSELRKKHAQIIIERLLKHAEAAARQVVQGTVATAYRFETYAGGALESYLNRLGIKGG